MWFSKVFNLLCFPSSTIISKTCLLCALSAFFLETSCFGYGLNGINRGRGKCFPPKAISLCLLFSRPLRCRLAKALQQISDGVMFYVIESRDTKVFWSCDFTLLHTSISWIRKKQDNDKSIRFSNSGSNRLTG